MRAILACLAIGLHCAGAAADDDVDACDLAASHPSDPLRVAPGVATENVVTHVAIPACRSAVERHPDNARFHYQLGRVIYYWAQANDGDPTEGIEHVRRAAELDYQQAQFVYGLLRRWDDDFCAAEPFVRAAANQGLKSARLTYVDDALANRYVDCESTAPAADLQRFLNGAKEQVEGYYETMLLDNLSRQLASTTAEP